jgi:hypothetical protein
MSTIWENGKLATGMGERASSNEIFLWALLFEKQTANKD